MSSGNTNQLPIAQTHPKSPITESYRTIRTNLQFASAVADVKIVMTTSTLPGEGKTSTISNTAIVTAQAGKRVLLVDADLRKPQVHQRFQVSNLQGLSSILIREGTLADCIVNTEVDGLYILPSGPIPPNPSELLASKRFAEVLEEASAQFDLILIDSPPVLVVTDALILGRVANGVIFVLDAQSTNRKLAQRAVSQLQQVDARILGTVLNRMKKQPGSDYHYYNYYGTGTAASV